MQRMCLHVNTCIPLSVECVFKCHSIALYVVRQCIQMYIVTSCMYACLCIVIFGFNEGYPKSYM